MVCMEAHTQVLVHKASHTQTPFNMRPHVASAKEKRCRGSEILAEGRRVGKKDGGEEREGGTMAIKF